MSTTISSIRLDSAEKERIELAARKLGISYNEFVRSSASERASEVLDEAPPTMSNADYFLAIAEELDFPDDTPTAESTIRDPFPGLIEREKRKSGLA